MIIDNGEKTVNDDENYLPSFCNSLSYNTSLGSDMTLKIAVVHASVKASL